MNPRQMEKMMKQMGMKQKEIKAKRIIVETDEGNLVFDSPSLTEIIVQGQSTFQLTGRYRIEQIQKELEIPDGDVELVCQQTGVSKEKALEALKGSNGDIAEAIVSLQS
ncbi:MAG TPA: nascent polypeptide-associated complex protein [Candidatus Methanofastidiosa archaeon]|nr:nascent polypeptide-associated complex protein [Candidatus Methanofastidiosa archaeon]HPR42124.1 nascent polypeptide-associated complex protein [Candidatus Methanofastidiosa archaeon]